MNPLSKMNMIAQLVASRGAPTPGAAAGGMPAPAAAAPPMRPPVPGNMNISPTPGMQVAEGPAQAAPTPTPSSLTHAYVDKNKKDIENTFNQSLSDRIKDLMSGRAR